MACLYANGRGKTKKTGELHSNHQCGDCRHELESLFNKDSPCYLCWHENPGKKKCNWEARDAD